MVFGIYQINSESDNTGGNNEVKYFTLKSIKKGFDFNEQWELYFLNEYSSADISTQFKENISA